jgi:hypothetical protein
LQLHHPATPLCISTRVIPRGHSARPHFHPALHRLST